MTMYIGIGRRIMANKKYKNVCRNIYKDVIMVNVIVIIFSTVLWFRFHNSIGVLFVPITIWISWIFIKISQADRYLSRGIDILKSIK